MKNFKFLSCLMAFILVFSSFGTVFAASFPDVSDTNYSWAEDAVEELADQGIINGYEDGTFRPENTVTKLESLVLVARILGVDEDEHTIIMEKAMDNYQDYVLDFGLPYGDEEIMFLLEKGIFTEDDIEEYLEKDANNGLKRYELAVILSKAMTSDANIKSKEVDYSDKSDIPNFARKYVAFVSEKGLMKGMGDNLFSPNTNVNRAQIAVVLQKLQQMTDYTYTVSKVTSIDTLLSTIKFIPEGDKTESGYLIKSDVVIRVDGVEAELKDIGINYNAIITTSGDVLKSIEAYKPDVDDQFKAKVVTASQSTLKLDKFVGTKTETVYFPVSKEMKIVDSENEPVAISKLASGAYVDVTIKKGKAVFVQVLDKTTTVAGIFKSITTEEGELVLTIEEVESEDDMKLYVGDSVAVTRNGSKSTMNELLAGDSMSITLTYNTISKIVATSKVQNKTGFIEAIKISATPSVIVKIDGESVELQISSEASYIVSGNANSDIYDLRLGAQASMTVESNTITKISTTVADTITQFSGTVELVNAAYNMIQISYYDTTTEQSVSQSVFVNSSTKIFNNTTGKTVALKNLEKGNTITIIGTLSTGVYLASTIIVLN